MTIILIDDDDDDLFDNIEEREYAFETSSFYSTYGNYFSFKNFYLFSI